jgi:hypothetical protein
MLKGFFIKVERRLVVEGRLVEVRLREALEGALG